VIAGRNPTAEIKARAENKENIIVTGTVDDLSPYFDQAWIYVCPLITGAGIKNKVLEAWSARIPLVATQLSCDGINVQNEEDFLIADTSAAFARAVVRLVRDKELRDKLVRSGRDKVVRQYDWNSKARALEEVFERAVANFNAMAMER